MPWLQIYDPIGHSIGLSALVALVPLAVIFACLAVFRMKAHHAALLALGTAAWISVLVWGMPAKLVLLATAQGAAFGIFPVFYIVVSTLFLYNITVEGGQFEVMRASLASVTADRRLQVLLIAFCFGAFIEGAAGFGTPVAIAGATLAGLGFRPNHAARVCLVANTAPVAFGAIGIPVVALGGVMGLNETGLMKLSAMIGHQLPFLSLFIPLYILLITVGVRKSAEVWPAIAVCGVTFALGQWAVASYVGPYLPDIIASIASMAALVLLLRVWKPRSVYTFDGEAPHGASSEDRGYTTLRIARAWCPYLCLMAMVLIWGLPPVKACLDKATRQIPVAGLDGAIVKDAASAYTGESQGVLISGVKPPAGPRWVPLPAKFKFDYLAAAGTAILIAALISAPICGVGARGTWRMFAKTCRDMRSPGVTIAGIVAFAYVMNDSGMTNSLAIEMTRTGRLYPFVAPFLGWLGVFLTGSDTSSNILFGGLQKTAAVRLGINPLVTGAANSSGGVMGKMISPQSLAVACAATGTTGEEGPLFRFTLKHSIFLALLVGVIVYLQAYYLTWMIPS